MVVCDFDMEVPADISNISFLLLTNTGRSRLRDLIWINKFIHEKKDCVIFSINEFGFEHQDIKSVFAPKFLSKSTNMKIYQLQLSSMFEPQVFYDSHIVGILASSGVQFEIKFFNYFKSSSQSIHSFISIVPAVLWAISLLISVNTSRIHRFPWNLSAWDQKLIIHTF